MVDRLWRPRSHRIDRRWRTGRQSYICQLQGSASAQQNSPRSICHYSGVPPTSLPMPHELEEVCSPWTCCPFNPEFHTGPINHNDYASTPALCYHRKSVLLIDSITSQTEVATRTPCEGYAARRNTCLIRVNGSRTFDTDTRAWAPEVPVSRANSGFLSQHCWVAAESVPVLDTVMLAVSGAQQSPNINVLPSFLISKFSHSNCRRRLNALVRQTRTPERISGVDP